MNLTFNINSHKVRDPLFKEHEFFDPFDLLQVKYEMLRKVNIEKLKISKVSKLFGFSRPSFYKANKDYADKGIAGVFPRKRGPQKPHKLTEPIKSYLKELYLEDLDIGNKQISKIIEKQFSTKIHPRTIDRICVLLKKKD